MQQWLTLSYACSLEHRNVLPGSIGVRLRTETRPPCFGPYFLRTVGCSLTNNCVTGNVQPPHWECLATSNQHFLFVLSDPDIWDGLSLRVFGMDRYARDSYGGLHQVRDFVPPF
jgi:hypothetical protein